MPKVKKVLANVILTGTSGVVLFGAGMWYHNKQVEAKVIEERQAAEDALKAEQIKASKVLTNRIRDELRLGGPVNSFKYTFNSVKAFHEDLLEKETDGVIKKALKKAAHKLIGKSYNANLKAEYTLEYVSKDEEGESFVKITDKELTVYLEQPELDFETDFDKSRFDTDVGAFLELLQAAIPDFLSDKYPSLRFEYTDDQRRLLYIKAVKTAQEKLLTEKKDKIEKLEKDTIAKIQNMVSKWSEAEGKKVVIKKNYSEIKINN